MNIELKDINTVGKAKNIGLLYLIEARGGLIKLLKEIDTEYKTGKLSRWQRDKLKACLKKANSFNNK